MSALIKFEDHATELEKLVESKMLPSHIKTAVQAFTVARQGMELGFPMMSSFNYIIPISGKNTLSAKAIGALLRRGGVKYKTTEDGVYVYKDGTTERSNIDKSYKDKDGEIVVNKPIDRRTTILFTRDGVDEESSYTWTDAVAQELAGKDNWRKMPKDMLFARALSRGANRIGADLLLGLYSADEMADALGTKGTVIRDEDGTIKEVIEAEYQEVQ